MRLRTALFASCLTLLAWSSSPAGGEIYGTISMAGGRKLSGPIRWDKNENFWSDRLDASKGEPLEHKPAEEGFRLRLFGRTVAEIGGESDFTRYNSFSTPFGELRSIEKLRAGRVRVVTRSGVSFELIPSSTDLGSQMRELLIDDLKSGRQSVSWSAFEKVEFEQAPDEEGRVGRDSERLYGAVETTAGAFEGFIVWDRDESMHEDQLDGVTEGVERAIAFQEIRQIERISGSASRITLDDGSTLELGGTNDVAEGHRGVIVAVSGLGEVDLPWDVVRSVTFKPAPASRRYDAFDGGKLLHGIVELSDGRMVRGRIVWDRDEEYGWELLDGEMDGVEFRLPFSNVRAVRRVGDGACEVELTGGKTLTLSGSNDVSAENKGLVLTPPGSTATDVPWESVRQVRFE